MTEIKYKDLKDILLNIEELKKLEFKTFDDALIFMQNKEPDGFDADVFHIERENNLFDFTWYEITGTIAYDKERKKFAVVGTLEVFYIDYVEPILIVEV